MTTAPAHRGARPEDIVPVGDPTVHEIFEHQVAAHPGAIALIDDEGRIGYAELDRRAARLAHRLAARGVRRGDVVGICVPRGAAMVVGILAVLKAGAGYLMLDPELPGPRRRELAERAAVRTTLADDDVIDRPGPELPRGAAGSHAGDPACVMVTSGSTGRPKAVVMPHRAIAGTLIGQHYLPPGPAPVWLQCAPVSWDAFALELWGALLFGGTCVLHPGQRPDPVVIARLVAAHGITAMYLSAGLFNVIVDEYPVALAGVRWLTVGGEAMSAAHARLALARHPGLSLRNGYGPVEAMIFVTTHPVTAPGPAGSTVPVGSPLAGKGVRVLDPLLRPVPDGETGEVYAVGAGLAHGYLHAPAATADRFVADPYGLPGTVMYRTGDLGRQRRGVLEFVGRADLQAKVSGYRVEPAEVEAALLRHPAVRRTVVVAEPAGHGDNRLVAYVVPHGGPAALPATTELRQHLGGSLPAYLVPSAFVAVEALPLTATGKVDRAALLRDRPSGVPAASAREAGTDLERRLAALWADALGLERVGVHDDFFVLGGTSLGAVRVAARVSVAEQRAVPAAQIVATPTVAGLAAHLAATPAEATVPIPRLSRPRVTAPEE